MESLVVLAVLGVQQVLGILAVLSADAEGQARRSSRLRIGGFQQNPQNALTSLDGRTPL